MISRQASDTAAEADVLVVMGRVHTTAARKEGGQQQALQAAAQLCRPAVSNAAPCYVN
jgi:hypothetical protein